MSWRLVDGVALPDAVAGHPALDFCNTRAGWSSASPKEYLVDGRALAVWVRRSGLLPVAGPEGDGPAQAGQPAPGAPAAGVLDGGAPDVGAPDAGAPAAGVLDGGALLARAVALREALYPVLLGRGTAADWDVVSVEAARARSRQRLVPAELAGAASATEEPQGAALRDTALRGPAVREAALRGAGPARWVVDPADPELALTAVAGAVADLLVSPLVGAVAACPGQGCGWLFADPRGRRRWCSMAVCGNRAKARRHAARHS